MKWIQVERIGLFICKWLPPLLHRLLLLLMKDEEMRRPATPSYVASSQQRNNNFTLDSVLNLNGCWSRSVWPRPLPLPPPPPSLTLLFHFFFGIFPAQLLPIGVDGDAHVTRGGGVEGVWLRPPPRAGLQSASTTPLTKDGAVRRGFRFSFLGFLIAFVSGCIRHDRDVHEKSWVTWRRVQSAAASGATVDHVITPHLAAKSS